MTSPENPAPSPANKPERGPRVRRREDPAADVIDHARSLRRALYEAGGSEHVDDFFAGDDAEGSELVGLIDTVRSENRPLKEYEQRYLSHMGLQREVMNAVAKVDFDELESDTTESGVTDEGDTLKGDEAVAMRIHSVIDLLQEEFDDKDAESLSDIDSANHRLNTEALQGLAKRLTSKLDTGISSTRYLQAQRTLEHDDSPENRDEAKDSLDYLRADEQDMHKALRALRVLAEYYPNENPRDIRDLPLDPAFDYAKAHSEQNPTDPTEAEPTDDDDEDEDDDPNAAQAANPTSQQPAAPAAPANPTPPPAAPVAPANPAPAQQGPVFGPPPPPVPPQGPTPPVAPQGPQNQNGGNNPNQPPANPNQNVLTQEQFDQQKLAAETVLLQKSRNLAKLSAKQSYGLDKLKFWKRGEFLAEKEAAQNEYNAAMYALATYDLNDVLRPDSTIDPNERLLRVNSYVIEKRALLARETVSEMGKTGPGRTMEFIKKHKRVLKLGMFAAGFVLSGGIGGAIAGGALAAGSIAAAKRETKNRGREFEDFTDAQVTLSNGESRYVNDASYEAIKEEMFNRYISEHNYNPDVDMTAARQAEFKQYLADHLHESAFESATYELSRQFDRSVKKTFTKNTLGSLAYGAAVSGATYALSHAAVDFAHYQVSGGDGSVRAYFDHTWGWQDRLSYTPMSRPWYWSLFSW